MEHFSSDVVAIEEIGNSFFRIDLSTPWSNIPQSGRFVTVQGADNSILKRPFSIAGFSDGICSIMVKVIGNSTDHLSNLKPGDKLNVLGPLGSGFPESDSQDIIYVGGGCGLPPLLYNAAVQPSEKRKYVFSGFRSSSDVLLKKEFESYGVEVSVVTEDGSEGEQGMVTDILKKFLDNTKEKHIIYASGPMMMLKEVDSIIQNRSLEGYLCLESYMACGFGACNGCVYTFKGEDGTTEYKKVCVDGPVFKSGEVVW